MPGEAHCSPIRLLLPSAGSEPPCGPSSPALSRQRAIPEGALPTLSAPLDDLLPSDGPRPCRGRAHLADPPRQGWTHGLLSSRKGLAANTAPDHHHGHASLGPTASVSATMCQRHRWCPGLSHPAPANPPLGLSSLLHQRWKRQELLSQTGAVPSQPSQLRGSEEKPGSEVLQTDSPNCKKQFILCRHLYNPRSHTELWLQARVEANRSKRPTDCTLSREPLPGAARRCSLPPDGTERLSTDCKLVMKSSDQYRPGKRCRNRQTDPKGKFQS